MKNGPFVNLYRIFVNLSHIQKNKACSTSCKKFFTVFCVYSGVTCVIIVFLNLPKRVDIYSSEVTHRSIRSQPVNNFRLQFRSAAPNVLVSRATEKTHFLKRPSRTLQIGACYIYFQHLCRTKATTPFGIVAYRNDGAGLTILMPSLTLLRIHSG